MKAKTIYVLIGPQGSGKTHWSLNTLLPQSDIPLVRVSQDEQGKQHRRMFQECIKAGASPVIDRMNFNFEQRNRYTQVAYENGYRIVYVLFDIDRETCLCRLAARKGHPTISQDADHDKIIDFYYREFEMPGRDEYDEMLIVREKGRCNLLDLRNVCFNKRVIVVGDIHGCFDEFMLLLDKCGYSVGDIVVATGDLVDRGPKIMETLEWFIDTPGAYSVEGNHDNKFRRYLNGNPVKVANGLDCTIEQFGDRGWFRWCAWLNTLPNMILLGDTNGKPTYVVHAGVDGRIPIPQQRVETCMYVRYLDGTSFFDDKGGIPWWDTLTGGCTVVSGHIINECPMPNEFAYCLDGGACQGRTLRALVIDNGERFVVEVDCNAKS